MTRTKTLASFRTLADSELTSVAGAHGRHHHKKHYKEPGFGWGSLVNSQSNVTGPIIQIAIGNSGPVTQVVGVSQSNQASF